MFTKCFEEGRAAADQPPADGGDSTKGEQSSALGNSVRLRSENVEILSNPLDGTDLLVDCQLL